MSTDTPPPIATSPPTATPEPTATPPPAEAQLEIVCVFFDGVVKTTESDEYVVVRNAGNAVAQLAGWILIDSADGKPEFVFPDYLLGPGVSVRVYTNEVHLEHGGFSFGSGRAIWNNTDPDTAALLDPGRREVSSATYPPGC